MSKTTFLYTALIVVGSSALTSEAGTLRGTVQLDGQQLVGSGYAAALSGDDRSGEGRVEGTTYSIDLASEGNYRQYLEAHVNNGATNASIAIARGTSVFVAASGETIADVRYPTGRLAGRIEIRDGTNTNGGIVDSLELVAVSSANGDRFTTRIYSAQSGNNFSIPVVASGAYVVGGRATVTRYRDGAKFTVPIGNVWNQSDYYRLYGYSWYQNYGTYSSVAGSYSVQAGSTNSSIVLPLDLTGFDASRASVTGQISVRRDGDLVSQAYVQACTYNLNPSGCGIAYVNQSGPYAIANLVPGIMNLWSNVWFRAPYGSYQFGYRQATIPSSHDYVTDVGFAKGTFKVKGMMTSASKQVYGYGVAGDYAYAGVANDQVSLAAPPGTWSLNNYAWVNEYDPAGSFYSQVTAPSYQTTIDPTETGTLPSLEVDTVRFELIIDSARWGGTLPYYGYISSSNLYVSRQHNVAGSRVHLRGYGKPGTYDVWGGAYPGPRYCYTNWDGTQSCYDSYGNVNGRMTIEPAVTTDVGTGVAIARTRAAVTFERITGVGLTSATNVFTGPLPNPGDDVVASGTHHGYWSVQTTAAFTGAIHVCFEYAGSAMFAEQELKTRLMQWNGSSWLDITTSLDTGADRVCGSSTSTGYYAVVTEADKDKDGFLAANDNCPGVPNADQRNTDGDKDGDACDDNDDNDKHLDGADNCPLAANDDQANLDKDPFGDACDADIDGDGVANAGDNCVRAMNTDQKNSDGDNAGDACDDDDDNDSDLDHADNCPLAFNPNQENLDNDLQGDVCDVDDDNDTVADHTDNCPADSNSGQLDTDGDGAGNECDADDDEDGALDPSDNCPLFPSSDLGDLDLDDIGDPCDDDVDGDGFVNDSDLCRVVPSAGGDIDSDGIGDECDDRDDRDRDQDGVIDLNDNCAEYPNPDQADLDSDGSGDPCDADDDNDTFADGDDNCPTLANDQLDTDGDQIGDRCDEDDDGDTVLDGADNCALVANPNQENADTDGFGNACDPDDDNDGFADDLDNCALHANSGQENNDGDARGDVCDADDDNDDVEDGADNCPFRHNADQNDNDHDGGGDACDADDDNDGLVDVGDNCAFAANSDQADNDGDDSGDVCDADDDNDGALDNADNCAFVANVDQADADEDLAGNACDADDDGDNLFDVVDNCVLTPNADQRDTDSDGTGDVCDDDLDGDTVVNVADNCREVPNSNQSDQDHDAIGDVCDPDLDGDGYDNAADNCPLVANAGQEDNEGDSVGDVCDPDDDNDHVSDGADNCPATANGDQLDTDGDHAGNACDIDDDNDNVLDGPDNCPLLANSSQADNEQDGIGDACDADDDNDGQLDGADNCPVISNAAQADFDADGAGDACDGDVDGDGVDNGADGCASTQLGSIIDRTGCSLAQLCPCASPRGQNVAWKNHGAYVSCVATTSNGFVKQGLFTAAQKESVQTAAANSTCGK